MRRSLPITVGLSLAFALMLPPLPGGAVLPAIAMLGKQIVQNIIIDDRKAFLDGRGAGFFLAPVVEKVRASIAGK